MQSSHHAAMRLYTAQNQRLYLNAQELARFLAAAQEAPAAQRRFALMLAYTGMRLSEARALTGDALQLEARIVSVRTLKKRGQHQVREIPIPHELVAEFAFQCFAPDELIWSQRNRVIPRSRAYRWIKSLMVRAGITGPKACPKGLRHAFGARAIMAGVPLHMLQRWMGHASMETTAIYATVLGPDQLGIADRMWGPSSP